MTEIYCEGMGISTDLLEVKKKVHDFKAMQEAFKKHLKKFWDRCN